MRSQPKTFKEACTGAKAVLRRRTRNYEFQSLSENKTWALVPRSSSENVISCKCVYIVKKYQTSGGYIGIRYNARVVACGFSQVKGVNFSETYAPVVKVTLIITLLVIVTNFQLYLRQMDVVAAFLFGKLDDGVYMVQPEQYENGNSKKIVCPLVRSLYGLEQAPSQWKKGNDTFFCGVLGMTEKTADMCL